MNYTQSEIYKSATPEQKIIWNNLFFKFGDNLSIIQFNYTGSHQLSPFWTFLARQYWYALQLSFGATVGAAVTTAGGVTQFNDENNTPLFYADFSIPSFNTSSASQNYSNVFWTIKNIHFANCWQPSVRHPWVNFIGYRLTY